MDQQNAMAAMTSGGVGIAIGLVAMVIGVAILLGAAENEKSSVLRIRHDRRHSGDDSVHFAVLHTRLADGD
jgi:hypothetical protein